MAKADEIFKQNAKEILEHGTDTRGQKVRPHWEDGTPAYTKKVFGVTNRYDLREEFPLLTLRKTGFKSCVNEILWIYQKCSNNIKDLKPHIWDEWADETGSIGKAYGYQAGIETAENLSGRRNGNASAGAGTSYGRTAGTVEHHASGADHSHSQSLF